MSLNDATEPDRKSGRRRGTCSFLRPSIVSSSTAVSERSTCFNPCASMQKCMPIQESRAVMVVHRCCRAEGNCRSLALPNFPIDLGGVDRAHAVFSTENRICGRVSEKRGRKIRPRSDDKVEVGGLPEDLLVGSRGPAESGHLSSSFRFFAGVALLAGIVVGKLQGRPSNPWMRQ
jgi:hypothetical protein